MSIDLQQWAVLAVSMLIAWLSWLTIGHMRSSNKHVATDKRLEVLEAHHERQLELSERMNSNINDIVVAVAQIKTSLDRRD